MTVKQLEEDAAREKRESDRKEEATIRRLMHLRREQVEAAREDILEKQLLRQGQMQKLKDSKLSYASFRRLLLPAYSCLPTAQYCPTPDIRLSVSSVFSHHMQESRRT